VLHGLLLLAAVSGFQHLIACMFEMHACCNCIAISRQQLSPCATLYCRTAIDKHDWTEVID
jgi:hypothetical protein